MSEVTHTQRDIHGMRSIHIYVDIGSNKWAMINRSREIRYRGKDLGEGHESPSEGKIE